MALIFANDADKQIGWTFSCEFLRAIQEKIKESEQGDETPSLEQIEDVLLAYNKLR